MSPFFFRSPLLTMLLQQRLTTVQGCMCSTMPVVVTSGTHCSRACGPNIQEILLKQVILVPVHTPLATASTSDRCQKQEQGRLLPCAAPTIVPQPPCFQDRQHALLWSTHIGLPLCRDKPPTIAATPAHRCHGTTKLHSSVWNSGETRERICTMATCVT